MKKLIQRILHGELGQSIIEYCIILGIIAIATIGGIIAMQDATNISLTRAKDDLLITHHP